MHEGAFKKLLVTLRSDVDALGHSEDVAHAIDETFTCEPFTAPCCSAKVRAPEEGSPLRCGVPLTTHDAPGSYFADCGAFTRCEAPSSFVLASPRGDESPDSRALAVEQVLRFLEGFTAIEVDLRVFSGVAGEPQ